MSTPEQSPPSPPLAYSVGSEPSSDVSQAGRVCSVHECGQPAAFELVWLDRAPRAYCWPCLRSRYYREPWASARQEPLPLTAPARVTAPQADRQAPSREEES